MGNNKAYWDFDFATNTSGEKFDPQKPINNSPNSTGLKELPEAKKALIWYTAGKTSRFATLGTGGRSAKTHLFDENGDDQETDFIKMFQIIKDSGWSGGYVGIEYEGGLMREMANKPEYLTNDEGIWSTKYLLEKVLDELGGS